MQKTIFPAGTQLAGHHLENRPDPARSLQHQQGSPWQPASGQWPQQQVCIFSGGVHLPLVCNVGNDCVKVFLHLFSMLFSNAQQIWPGTQVTLESVSLPNTLPASAQHVLRDEHSYDVIHVAVRCERFYLIHQRTYSEQTPFASGDFGPVG